MPDWKQAVTNGSCKENEGCGTASTCMCALAEDMADEIERLREALRQVSCSCGPKPGCSKGYDCKEFIARAALGEEK